MGENAPELPFAFPGRPSIEKHMKLATEGFEMMRNVFSTETCADLIRELGPVSGAGRRLEAFSPPPRLFELAAQRLENTPKAVRAILFDKSPDTNWLVTWHQDLTIAVREKREASGFGPWSVKEGLPHVQPPAELLERMLTLRLHLDDADEENGALHVLPGTHALGKLDTARIQALRAEISVHACKAKAGDVLLMRPLLLHASSKSTSERHRRILHIEFSGFELLGGLVWA
jgi:hypothetical protein